VEPELFPCLRQLNMCFIAYNPLAGGLLSGKYSNYRELPAVPGRFQGNDWAERYRQRFWRESVFNAIDAVKGTLPADTTMTDASLRWMLHHSALKGEKGDGLILGASNVGHVEKNLQAVKGGPLPADVVDAFERAWELCRGDCPPYFR
jgi:aflatoxin B1 aldehyde reductase